MDATGGPTRQAARQDKHQYHQDSHLEPIDVDVPAGRMSSSEHLPGRGEQLTGSLPAVWVWLLNGHSGHQVPPPGQCQIILSKVWY